MSDKRKIILLFALFFYVVTAGILIADMGTSSVSGAARRTLVGRMLSVFNPAAEDL